MKVLVCTFYDDAIANYGDLTSKINKKYCDKHNFDYIVSHTPTYKNRHPAWENLPLILKHIENYDYVVWIDADAFFYIDSPNIEDIIQSHLDTDFIFSRDLPNKEPPLGEINTGIFIVKNTYYSIKFLKSWAYNEDLFQNCKMKYRWDQGVLNDMIRDNVMSIREHMIDCHYGLLQHFFREELDNMIPKPYIYHMAGRRACNKEHERIDHSQEYYAQICTNDK